MNIVYFCDDLSRCYLSDVESDARKPQVNLVLVAQRREITKQFDFPTFLVSDLVNQSWLH